MQNKHGGDIREVSRATGRALDDLIDFSSSINPEGLARGAREAAIALLNNRSLSAAYPDPCSVELTAAINRYLGAGVGEDNILAGNGSTEFIYLIPKVLRPRKALIVEPAFSEYAPALTREGAEVIPFFLSEGDGFALDPGALKKALKDLRPDCLYMANPTNLMGRLLEKKELLAIADYCRGLGVLLVVDEAFIDFHEACSIKKEASLQDNIIVLRSMTKFFALAALRLGYMVTNKDLVERFRRLLPTWSVNTVASAAGVASLRDSAYIERAEKWLAKEGPSMRKALSSITGLKTYPGSANFITSRLTTGAITAVRLRDLLIKKGFLIRDLSNISGLGEGFFRMAVRGTEENRLILTALKDILEKESP